MTMFLLIFLLPSCLGFQVIDVNNQEEGEDNSKETRQDGQNSLLEDVINYGLNQSQHLIEVSPCTCTCTCT